MTYCLLFSAGGLSLIEANIDTSSLQIYGSGRSGGPDSLGGNNFTQGGAMALTTTNPNTFLYNPNLTWQDSSNTEVTYSTTVTGGLDEVATNGSIVIKGRIIHGHDAVDPDDSIWFGTAGINLLVESSTPFTVSTEVTIVNSLNDPSGEFVVGADVFLGSDFSDYDRSIFRYQNSTITDSANGSATLPPGSYNLDIYGNKWIDNSLQGGNLTFDYTIRLQSAPSVPMSAFLNNGSVGTFDTVTPGTLKSVIGMAPGEGPEFEIGADGKFYASVSSSGDTLNEYSAGGVFLRNVINDPEGALLFTGMEITDTTFYAARSTQGSNAAPSTLGIVDLVAETFTPIGIMTGTSGPTSGLAWDGSAMYAVTGGSSSPQLFLIDLSTGAATPIGSGVGVDPGVAKLTGLEFGCDGVLYALDRFGGANLDGALYTVDPTTGVFTPAGDFAVTTLQGAVNAIATPPVAPADSILRLAFTPNTGNPDNYDFEWSGRGGSYYKLVSSPDLSIPVSGWPVWEGHVNIAGCGKTIILANVPGGGDDMRFFSVVESDATEP